MSQFLRKFFIFKLNRKGQHVMEYAMIITAIIVGIIIMRPYVIRSWNAQVKGWEDSVYDSYHDQLVEAPEDSINIQGCHCTWTDGACGPVTSGPTTNPPSLTCPELTRLQIGVCFPQGCENNPQDPQLTVRCDTTPLHPCCVTQLYPDSDFDPQLHCGVNAGCGDCEIKLQQTCTDPALSLRNPPWCSADIPNDIASSSVDGNRICCFECTGANNVSCETRAGGVQALLHHQYQSSCEEEVGFCPGTTSALTRDTPVRTIAFDDSCSNQSPCTIQCAEGFTPYDSNGDGVTDDCRCKCPVGQSPFDSNSDSVADVCLDTSGNPHPYPQQVGWGCVALSPPIYRPDNYVYYPDLLRTTIRNEATMGSMDWPSNCAIEGQASGGCGAQTNRTATYTPCTGNACLAYCGREACENDYFYISQMLECPNNGACPEDACKAPTCSLTVPGCRFHSIYGHAPLFLGFTLTNGPLGFPIPTSNAPHFRDIQGNAIGLTILYKTNPWCNGVGTLTTNPTLQCWTRPTQSGPGHNYFDCAGNANQSDSIPCPITLADAFGYLLDGIPDFVYDGNGEPREDLLAGYTDNANFFHPGVYITDPACWQSNISGNAVGMDSMLSHQETCQTPNCNDSRTNTHYYIFGPNPQP